MLATLRQPRWLGLAALVVLLSIAFWWLGTWQWHRHVTRSAANDAIDTALRTPPAPLGELMPDPSVFPSDVEFRRVEVSGTYLSEGQVLQRNPRGRSGFEVLTPLALDTGGTLLIDRGWAPPSTSDPNTPGVDVAPPTGPVRLVGRLRPPEEPSDRSAPPGQVYDIIPAELPGDPPSPIYLAYAELAEQDPAVTDVLELPSADDLGMGPHLFYAIQWWLFIGIAVVGFVVLLRREAREPTADTSHSEE